jgi:hypothetical protein
MISPACRICALLLVALAGLLVSPLSSSLSRAAEFPGLGPPGTLNALQVEPATELVLQGPNARGQILVTGVFSSGQQHDFTHQVSYKVAATNIVRVDAEGFVTPLADGQTTITASEPGGKSVTLTCRVENFAKPHAINFANEIVPIFTKLGCNAGGCHGKSGGQNGFKLSLLGFYPDQDYEWLVKEHRGRRIFQASPEFSLILTKPLNKLPHGGGRRLDEGSYEWELLTRWIEQGMPYGAKDDPVVERIEVFPKQRDMNRDARQQLRVLAHYTDGTTRDVTRLAEYHSNATDMAESTTTGRVTVFDRPGEAAVMVRFQGQVTVFRAGIPLGVAVTNLPPEKNFIDKFVFGKLKQLGIPPSPLCDDATFVRRVYLDITGRLPTADEAKQFAASTDPAKRDKLVDYLLETPEYGDYFANKWTMVLRNRRVQNVPEVSFRFHDWVRRAMQENMPFDQFVREILASSGDIEVNPTASWYTQVPTASEQMEDVAQLFLGMRIQCAKCHHHPFERWSQADYYGFEAFFSQVGLRPNRRNLPNADIYHKGGLATAKNPRTSEDMKPAGLGGQPLDIPVYEDPRHALVDWMAAPDNPFFARALANRYWKHFFGRGIVDPEDDLRVTNPPSNPELLDALAAHFIATKFNLKEMVRTICRSSAYQLSSEPNEFNQGDRQNFSSFYPRRLQAEPLYDAINQVADTHVNFSGMPQRTRAVQLPDAGFNDYFLSVFGKPQAESACECERSAEANLAQSLHLLNSSDIQGKINAAGARAERLSNDQDRADSERLTELYYWAYARPPREEELKRVVEYVEGQANKRQAYEDVMWALFNTKEFLFVR